MSERLPRIVALCSGRPGLGKSTTAANLAAAASREHIACLLWDAQLHSPRLHLHYALNPVATASDAYIGKARIEDIPIQLRPNFWLLPERTLNSDAEAQLTEAFPALLQRLLSHRRPELVIINLPPGWSELTATVCQLADLCCLVTGDDIGSILDTYALAKALLSRGGGGERHRLGLIVTGVVEETEAHMLTRKFNAAAVRFLGQRIPLLGAIPYEPQHRIALLQQRPFVEAFPESAAALFYRRLLQRCVGPQQADHAETVTHEW